VLAVASLACGSLLAAPTPTPTPDTLIELPITPTLLPTTTPGPEITTATVAPTLLPSPTIPLTPTPDYPWSAGDVRVFPGPDHYVGDDLTIEIAAYNLDQLSEPIEVPLYLNDDLLSDEPFIARSPLRADTLVYRWVWDTSQLEPGQYRLTAYLPDTPQGDEQKIRIYINLGPEDKRPEQEEGAVWVQRNTPSCCLLNVITNTAAYRDLDHVSVTTEDAVAHIEEMLGSPVEDRPIPITMIDNVWGNGGYLKDEIVTTYIDRAYVSPDTSILLRHEIAHWAMRAYSGNNTPALLSEGIAVYLAGGHYKPEDIPVRAAVLAEMGIDLPLDELADTFWSVQHEAAYIEAGGFVTFLINTYGIDRFLRLYGVESRGNTPSAWLDDALNQTYGLSIQRVDRAYHLWLDSQTVTDADREDVRLSMALMDTTRRYQDLYAEYQESLPTAAEAIEAGQTAEFMREPRTPYNITLETMLLAAHRALSAGDTSRATALIEAVSATLSDTDFSRELVADYLAIVEAVDAEGMEAQEIVINGDTATVTAAGPVPELHSLSAAYGDDGWEIVQ